MRGKVGKFIKEYSIITFGAVLAAAAIYFFMLPSHLAIGSGSALAMVLSNFIPLPISAISLALNIIFLIMGFILVGPEFGAKTVYTTILVPASLGVFEILFPNFQSLTQDPLLDMICYILVVGMAMAILFSCNASSGGLDIIAKIMNKHLKMELGTAISVSGLVVAFSAAFCYDTKTVVLSVLGTYFGGMIVDKFIFGLNIKRRVCIISQTHNDEIVSYLLHDLHSGATLYESFGAYDGTKRIEIVTIVDKNEYRKLMDFVKKTDPKAFVTVYSVNELRYQPKVK
ncbi:MAG: YitT family protein [Clostridia bacterium]|nr:YitT family protein [Clostridia bacterium]